MLALLDNTILSNFALVGGLDLLRLTLGGTAATVGEVLAEYEAGVQIGRLPRTDWSWLPILNPTEAEREVYAQLRVRLNPGEAACLALAAVGGYQVLTDDRAARAMAMQMRIPVSGTLGLLIRLVDQGQLSLSDGDGLLQHMIVMGYRSPVVSLTEIT